MLEDRRKEAVIEKKKYSVSPQRAELEPGGGKYQENYLDSTQRTFFLITRADPKWIFLKDSEFFNR